MDRTTDKPIDKATFSLALMAVLFVSVGLIIFNETIGPVIVEVYNWVAFNFSLVFQWAAIGAMGVLIWLAFGKHGKIKFGDTDEKPEFSTMSWVAMLFSTGIGGGLLYWSGIEWAFYYQSPPMGAVAKSDAAIQWATSYGLFHWGITAWCIYALPTVAMCYSFYIKKIPYLRLSAAILGEKCTTSMWAKPIDLAFMLGLIGGAGTSLSLTVPMISTSIAELTPLYRSAALDIVVVVICVALFGSSVYMGLQKGIKKLSDANLYISIAFLIFVLIAGPTSFILMMGTQSLGAMITNTLTMLTWTDPVHNTGWIQSWTIFYWAWWIAYAPFVGIFVTRISKGRTIREVILSMCIYGSFGAWAFYMVLGNYALSLELAGTLPVVDMVAADPFTAITAIILSLPMGEFALGIFSIVVLIYVATTYDSASYTLASAATKELHAGEDPARWHRLFWAFILAVLPIALMFIGGLKVVQSATLLSGLPLAIAGFFMTRTLLKWLKEDHP